jgi:hypothetical protein
MKEMDFLVDAVLFGQQFFPLHHDRRATITFIEKRIRMRAKLAMMEWAKTPGIFEDADDVLDAWSHAEDILSTAVKIIELEARLAGEDIS